MGLLYNVLAACLWVTAHILLHLRVVVFENICASTLVARGKCLHPLGTEESGALVGLDGGVIYVLI